MTDDVAIEGEEVGYVPCDDVAAVLDVEEEGAIFGIGTGYVPQNQAASSLPIPEREAIVGSEVGFVPGPCCACTDPIAWDNFNRVVGSGLGSNSRTSTAYTNQFSTGIFGVNGSAFYTSESGVAGWYNADITPFAGDFVMLMRIWAIRMPARIGGPFPGQQEAPIVWSFHIQNSVTNDNMFVEISMGLFDFDIPRLILRWDYSVGAETGGNSPGAYLGTATTDPYIVKWCSRRGFKMWLESDDEPEEWIGEAVPDGFVRDRVYITSQSTEELPYSLNPGASSTFTDYVEVCW